MKSFIKFLYYLSIIYFLINIFFSYYQSPEFVGIGFNEKSGTTEYKSKHHLFYFGAGLFLLVTALVAVFRKTIINFPFSLFPFPNKTFWMQNQESREGLVNAHQVWMMSFATMFNLFLGSLFLILFLVNIVQYGTFSSYAPVVFGGIIILGFWWIILVIRLYIKKIEL